MKQCRRWCYQGGDGGIAYEEDGCADSGGWSALRAVCVNEADLTVARRQDIVGHTKVQRASTGLRQGKR